MGNSGRSPFYHNSLLLAAGAALGCAATLTFQYLFTPAVPDAIANVPGSPEQAKPAHFAGDSPPGDIQDKLSRVLASGDREHRADDLRRLGRETADGDEAKALKQAETLKGDADRAGFLRGVMESMAAKNPKAAAEYAHTHFAPGAQQAEALRIALGAWANQSPRDAYAWAESHLSGPVKEEAIHSIVQRWATNAPEAAADWFVQTRSTSQPLLNTLAGAWGANNPKAAASWVETLADAGNRQTGRVAIAREWAAQNPSAAAGYFTPFLSEPAPPGSTSSPGLDLATVLADIWGTTNPAGAAEWIAKLPAGPAREQAAGTLATVWAASDMEGAVAWSNTIADASIRAAAVDHIATTWGAIEPDKAIAWLDTQPPDLAANGYRGAWNSWAATDPAGLQEWIGSMNPGDQADLARRSLGDVMMASDPAGALDLAFGIRNEGRQSDAITRYYRQFSRLDEPSAQEWLQNEWDRLPASAQTRIRQGN